jgi:hypothetical protein
MAEPMTRRGVFAFVLAGLLAALAAGEAFAREINRRFIAEGGATLTETVIRT